MTPDWYVLACMFFVGVMAFVTGLCVVLLYTQDRRPLPPLTSPQTDAARARLRAEAERGRV